MAVFRFQDTGYASNDDSVQCSRCRKQFSVMQNRVIRDSFGWYRSVKENASRSDLTAQVTGSDIRSDDSLTADQGELTLRLSQTEEEHGSTIRANGQSNTVISGRLEQPSTSLEPGLYDSDSLSQQAATDEGSKQAGMMLEAIKEWLQSNGKEYDDELIARIIGKKDHKALFANGDLAAIYDRVGVEHESGKTKKSSTNEKVNPSIDSGNNEISDTETRLQSSTREDNQRDFESREPTYPSEHSDQTDVALSEIENELPDVNDIGGPDSHSTVYQSDSEPTVLPPEHGHIKPYEASIQFEQDNKEVDQNIMDEAQQHKEEVHDNRKGPVKRVKWSELSVRHGNDKSPNANEREKLSELWNLPPDNTESEQYSDPDRQDAVDGSRADRYQSKSIDHGGQNEWALKEQPEDSISHKVNIQDERDDCLESGSEHVDNHSDQGDVETFLGEEKDREDPSLSAFSVDTATDVDSVQENESTRSAFKNRFDEEPAQREEHNLIDDRKALTLRNRESNRSERFSMDGVDQFVADRPNPLKRILWSLVALGFLFLLGLQVRMYLVDRYAQDERFRPYLAFFCQVAACELPVRYDPYQLVLTNTDVKLHSDKPDAITVTVKFVNQASFPQPYPDLSLILNDRLGWVIGRRTYRPETYLGDTAQKLIQSNEQVVIDFELAHPDKRAVGFIVDIVR